MRRPWSATGTVLLAALSFAVWTGGQPGAVARAPAEPAPISGVVLDRFRYPLPDQIVAIGAEKTTSDGEGRFSLPGVPGRYDLVIANPDGTRATVYRGLTRRDPMVVFEGARVSKPAHTAEIAVTLIAADTKGVTWQVQFVSARAFGSINNTAWKADGDKVSNADRLVVKWDGAAAITGVVMAHAMRVQNLDIPLALFAQQPVSLRAGETLAIELRPAKAPVVRRPSPVVQVPKEDPGFDPIFLEEYRLLRTGYGLRGPGPVSAPYDIPDLTGFGFQLCGDGYQWNPFVHSRRVQCGGRPDARISLVLPKPPAFKSPAWDTVATPGMRFAWTPVRGATYVLSLASASGDPTAALPRIEIFTAETTAAWPDLHAVGVEYPRPVAVYAATIGSEGPFASMDDLVGPRGLADMMPRDRWRTESKELSIQVRPPLGKEEAACKFRESVICDSPELEIYRLSVLNRKIQTYPDFAAAVNIHCVRDCAGARAYLKAYGQYAAAHPGFDENQPLPVPGPEPVPPPEMFEGRKRAFSGGR